MVEIFSILFSSFEPQWKILNGCKFYQIWSNRTGTDKTRNKDQATSYIYLFRGYVSLSKNCYKD